MEQKMKVFEGIVEADEMNDGSYWLKKELAKNKEGKQLYTHSQVFSLYDVGKRVRVTVEYLD